MRKKGKAFMPFKERKLILENIKGVDEVIDFLDDELGSCINALNKIKDKYPEAIITFCNGGDRDENIPEMSVSDIEFRFNVGGSEKVNSSSWILRTGNLIQKEGFGENFLICMKIIKLKVKELIIQPQKEMSFQRHNKRSEIWLISTGRCLIKHSKDLVHTKELELTKHDSFHIELGDWHQIINPYDEVCKIIEIQYGKETKEEDIERIQSDN